MRWNDWMFEKDDKQELESKEGPLSTNEVEAFMDLVFSFDPSNGLTLKEKINQVAREISEKEGQLQLLKELIKNNKEETK